MEIRINKEYITIGIENEEELSGSSLGSFAGLEQDLNRGRGRATVLMFAPLIQMILGLPPDKEFNIASNLQGIRIGYKRVNEGAILTFGNFKFKKDSILEQTWDYLWEIADIGAIYKLKLQSSRQSDSIERTAYSGETDDEEGSCVIDMIFKDTDSFIQCMIETGDFLSAEERVLVTAYKEPNGQLSLRLEYSEENIEAAEMIVCRLSDYAYVGYEGRDIAPMFSRKVIEKSIKEIQTELGKGQHNKI